MVVEQTAIVIGAHYALTDYTPSVNVGDHFFSISHHYSRFFRTTFEKYNKYTSNIIPAQFTPCIT